jgi:small nuclear ribonucleoprotein (snRNP)-like protein
MVINRIFFSIFILLFSSVAWLYVRQGLADIRAESVFQLMLTWQSGNLEVDIVRQAHDSMLQANALDPSNPTYLHRLGRLSHLLMSLEQYKRSDWGEISKAYYIRSLTVRPEWGLTWANLALVKADLLEFDAEMNLALTKATELGPWEPSVLIIVSEIATRRNQFLGSELRIIVAANVARGLRSTEIGTAASINNMLNGVVLNIEIVRALEDLLVTKDWEHNTDQLMRVALQYYDEWRPAEAKVIRSKIVQEISNRPRTVHYLAEKNRYIQFCPYLPRSPTLRKACTQF